MEDAASLGQKFAVTVAAASGLGKGVETAFGPVDDGKADIDTGLDELGGNEDDGAAYFSQSLRLGEDEHDMPRAHAGG